MPELTQVETPKNVGFVQTSSQREKRQLKLKQEEAELEALLNPKEEDKDKDDEHVEQEAQEAKETAPKEDKPLSSEEQTFKKRYGDLRRHSQKLEEKIKALESRVTDSSVVPPKSDEDIDAWAKKYPDIAGIVENIATRKAKEMFADADERLKKLDEQQEQFNRGKAEGTIRAAHSDFDKLRESDEFHDWAGEQPRWVQDALYENADDPGSVIRVIDLYKMDKGLTSSAKKDKAKEAAKAVESKSKAEVKGTEEKPIFKESQIEKNSEAWFEKNYDAIMEAQREGRLIYDVSGRAR